MKSPDNVIEVVKNFIETRILQKYEGAVSFKETNDLLEITDINALRAKLTIVFWANSSRVTILIEDQEVMDEEFISKESLIHNIDCLISNEILKTEKFKKDKLFVQEYEYSTIVDGKEIRIKDKRKLGSVWLSKPDIKYTRYIPW